VLDFGLASRIPAAEMETMTRTRRAAANGGPLAGTLAYLAPELLRGSAADKRSDIWALGVLLYEMAAGRLPFQGATPFDLTAAILNGTRPVLPAALPLPLQSVIGKCLARDPAQRYRDAGELRVALETVQLGSDPSMAWRDELRRAVRRAPRWRRPLLIAGVAALVLAGAVGLTLFNAKRTLALTDRDTLLVADFVNTTGDDVFDRTLKQALSIHLEQSPFLSVVSREEERATLRLMTKSPDDRLTGAVVREACQRIGAKAMIEGTIAAVGSHYAIGLDALNCQSGATIGSEQGEASNREQVLTMLGAAASRLRRKLGESLPTIQRFDKPIEQATTSSLEAFQAFSAAEDIRSRTSELGAVPFYKRAIELDPDFALAYARLSAVYGTLGQAAAWSRNAEEAYARRDRVSERERFYIDAQHCADPDCRNNVFELWKRTYPRDGRPRGNLSGYYYGALMCDKALENAQESLRLDPGYSQPYAYVARAYLCLEKPAEAHQTLEQALSRHLESPFIYIILFRVAFYERDDRAIQQVRKWATGQPEESLFKEFESEAAAFDGQMRRSRELRLHAERLAAVRLRESVLPARARGAVYEAAQGNFQRARDGVKSIAAESPPASVIPLLLTAAVMARDYDQADVLLRGRSPLNQGPPALLDAVVRVLREVAAGDRSAISRLPPASPRELTGGLQSFYPAYVRGLAYLLAGDGGTAVAEFQRILDHRGLEPISPLYPLAFVQQARAYVLIGDSSKARKAYQDFLALWKDADPDIPILREAKAEHARLMESSGAGR
jgi:tetratricopeptide (TPR) repeat protein